MFVARRVGAVVGYYSLRGPGGGEVELDAMFVEPAHIGSGIGTAMMHHAVAQACRLGAGTLAIQADPRAEGFYRARGARRVGTGESGSVPGRCLPLPRLDLAGRGAAGGSVGRPRSAIGVAPVRR